MKRSTIETVLGAVVLFVAGFFLVFSYKTADVGAVDGYPLTADFSETGGLAVGDKVVIGGVKVGSITAVTLNPEDYQATVHMNIDPGIKIPDDTAAAISSTSLLGGKYLSLEPGGSEEMLAPGGRIPFTQAPQNLEQLLGKFIFTMQKDSSGKKDGDSESEAGDEEAPEEVDPGAGPAPVPDPLPQRDPLRGMTGMPPAPEVPTIEQ